LANKVLVLNFGEKIAEGDSSDIFNDEKVKRAYFGGETTYVFK